MTPPGGWLNLGPVHTAIDANGNAVQLRTASWTRYYDAADHEVLTAQGYATQDGLGNWTVFTLVNPISVTRRDGNNLVTDQIQLGWGVNATHAGSLNDFPVTNISDQTTYTAWTTYQYTKLHLTSTRVYYAIPTSGAGTSTSNYLETDYGYEMDDVAGQMNRLEWAKSPDGTIVWNVFDDRGNVMQTWMGTGDVPSDNWNDIGGTDWTDFEYWLRHDRTSETSGPAGTNMVLVSTSIYDNGQQGGDGVLTESRSYYADASYYAADYQDDWRDRQTETLTPDGVATVLTLDNLDRVTEPTPTPTQPITTLPARLPRRQAVRERKPRPV